jgi:hypothetical protein
LSQISKAKLFSFSHLALLYPLLFILGR